jgi:hypothetical protein
MLLSINRGGGLHRNIIYKDDCMLLIRLKPESDVSYCIDGVSMERQSKHVEHWKMRQQ